MNTEQNRNRLLRKLQEEDFAVYEAILYLDGNPGCAKALAYYQKHRLLAERLREEYQMQYGPLKATEVNTQDWSWVKGPWPWEREAN